MSFVDAIKVCLTQKFADFSGRASRSEFWWFFLFQLIVLLILGAVHAAVYVIGFLALLVPGVAAAVRRLHDTGKSGFWALLGLIPLIGLVLLVLLALPGTEGANDYGDPPPQAAGA